MKSTIVAAALLFFLSGCNPPPTPGPTPTTSPSGPPTPTPTAAPLPGYDCSNPPRLTGLLTQVKGIKGQYTVVMKRYAIRTMAGNEISGPLAARTVAERYKGLSNVRLHRKGFSAKADVKTASAIAKDPDVLFVHESVPMHKTISWGQDRVDQEGFDLDGRYEPDGDGAGVHAVVVDTWLDTAHSEFSGRVGENYVPFGPDSNIHATHVGGTILGTTWGIARRATLHSAQVLGPEGNGSDSDVIRGIDFAVDLKHRTGWDVVINMSLGGGVSPALDHSVCEAIAAGVSNAVAAGNDFGFDACEGSPGRVAQAITVAASDRLDNAANFSNTGRCVDIWAPGVDIQSAKAHGGDTTLSGTSMATPHVTGAALLYLQHHPGAEPAEVAAALISNANSRIRNPGFSTTDLLLFVKGL